jgi:hypothetical protein
MVHRMVRLVLIIATIVSSGISLFGYPVRALQLGKLMDASECVAVIDVASISQEGRISIDVNGHTVDASANTIQAKLLRIIKGPCPDQVTIKSYTPDRFVGSPGLKRGPQIAFLRLSEGRLVFADRNYPSLPALMGSSTVASGIPAAPIDRVVAELAAVLSSPAASASDKFEVLAVSYALPSSVVMTSSLRVAMTTTAVPAQQNIIEAELIRRGDVQAVESVTSRILASQLSADAQAMFLQVIASHLTEAKAAPSVIRLLESGNVEVRRAAAEALWHIADVADSQVLTNCLSDPDMRVRYYAVRGLADIHHQPQWGPTEQLFDRDPAHYLDHWSKWGKTQ